MENKITEEKIEKYFHLTKTALKDAEKNIFKNRQAEAKEIIEMVSNYLSDAKHFFEKGKWVETFGALNYAHGWLDAGARLKIFDVHDDALFSIAD
jgi:hypothetical protein